MFSPSLTSFLLHSFPPPAPAGTLSVRDTAFIAGVLARRAQQHGTGPGPLPILGRITKGDIHSVLKPYVETDSAGGALYFWGRVPVAALLASHAEEHEAPAADSYIDLGTPMSTGGGGFTYNDRCEELLEEAVSGERFDAIAAVVDLGDPHDGAPGNYNEHLTHAVTCRIKMSKHAEQVLSVLLARLQQNQVLSRTAIHCALVSPPPLAVKPSFNCFEQATTVEVIHALKALHPHVVGKGVPAAINLSLGTHVGPHNGDSPLEDYIRAQFTRPEELFVVAAAGNGGEKALSARRNLLGSEHGSMVVLTGRRCRELLVEIWWDDTQDLDVTVDAAVSTLLPTGGLKPLDDIKLGPGMAATMGSANVAPGVMQAVPCGPDDMMITYTLVSGKCCNNLSCMAFALSTRQKELPLLHVRFRLRCSQDVILNAWIAAAERDPDTLFVNGGQESSVTVPATAASVLSVAGLEHNAEVWDGSSSGPAAQYHLDRQGGSSPLMAHLATLGGERGTSFASPRACADAVKGLLDPVRKKEASDATGLLCAAYGKQKNDLPRWSPRTGYHKAT